MDNIIEILPQSDLDPQLMEEIRQLGRLKKVRAGDVIFYPNNRSEEMPLVLSGLLKLMRQGDNGNEIFLYYLEPGEACAMSITCCITEIKNNFKLVAETDARLWMVPMGNLDRWIVKYPSFRKFVFTSYQQRFNELLESIDAISFMKMDERLYKFLLDKKQATGSYVIQQTHQQIAHELNTSRVVISRLLKQLENEEKIQQFRNRIEIL